MGIYAGFIRSACRSTLICHEQGHSHAGFSSGGCKLEGEVVIVCGEMLHVELSFSLFDVTVINARI